MALCLRVTQPAVLRICSFTLPLSPCHHFLLFSALSSPWGGFVSNVPQRDPLRLQETSELASDFDILRSFFNFLSVSEVHGLGTKYTMGLVKTQEAMSLPMIFCKCSRPGQPIGEVPGVWLRDIIVRTASKKRTSPLKSFFFYFFPLTAKVFTTFSN